MSRADCPICGDRANVVLTMGDLRLAMRDHSVTWRGAPVEGVRPTGFEILAIMMADPGRHWGADQLVIALDPYGLRGLTEKTVFQHMHVLRKALPDSILINSREWHGYWLEPAQVGS